MPAQGVSPGMMLGGFEIIKLIGSGGMGDVYLATQTVMKREVALKVLHPGVTADHEAAQRFFAEIEIVGRLNHPNIVTAFDAGNAEGYHYMAMAFVDGEDLDKKVARSPIPERDALLHCIEVANALGYAWDKFQMCHRDIKPGNIMIDHDGDVKLLDMGLAQTYDNDSNVSTEGNVIGTPFYISPEQAKGEKDADCRADIYSLGATLYYLVTAIRPFSGTNPLAVIAKHLSDKPQPPKQINPLLSEETNQLILRMLAKDPNDRPRDWGVLRNDMEVICSRYTETPFSHSSAGLEPDVKKEYETLLEQASRGLKMGYLAKVQMLLHGVPDMEFGEITIRKRELQESCQRGLAGREKLVSAIERALHSNDHADALDLRRDAGKYHISTAISVIEPAEEDLQVKELLDGLDDKLFLVVQADCQRWVKKKNWPLLEAAIELLKGREDPSWQSLREQLQEDGEMGAQEVYDDAVKYEEKGRLKKAEKTWDQFLALPRRFVHAHDLSNAQGFQKRRDDYFRKRTQRLTKWGTIVLLCVFLSGGWFVWWPLLSALREMPEPSFMASHLPAAIQALLFVILLPATLITARKQLGSSSLSDPLSVVLLDTMIALCPVTVLSFAFGERVLAPLLQVELHPLMIVGVVWVLIDVFRFGRGSWLSRFGLTLAWLPTVPLAIFMDVNKPVTTWPILAIVHAVLFLAIHSVAFFRSKGDATLKAQAS